MFDFVSAVASQIFVDGVYIDFAKEEQSINIRFKNFVIKDENANGVIIDHLNLFIENFKKPEGGIDLNNASYIFQKLNLLVSEKWINMLLSFDDNLQKNGIENLRVNLTPKKISILGTLKKGFSFNFSIDLKLIIDNGRLVINFDRFWAGNYIPLPRFVQSTLLGILKNVLTTQKYSLKGINFVKQYILINHKMLLPVDCYISIDKFHIDDNFLAFECSADREAAINAIQKKNHRQKNEGSALPREESQSAGENYKKSLFKEDTAVTIAKEFTKKLNQELNEPVKVILHDNKFHPAGEKIKIRIDGRLRTEDN